VGSNPTATANRRRCFCRSQACGDAFSNLDLALWSQKWSHGRDQSDSPVSSAETRAAEMDCERYGHVRVPALDIGGYQSPADRETFTLEGHIGPAEPEDLAASHPGGSQDAEAPVTTPFVSTPVHSPAARIQDHP
jgi:hypothetical protein